MGLFNIGLKKKEDAPLPPGLRDLVAAVLTRCVGRDKYISRAALVSEVQLHNPEFRYIDERLVRRAISELRKSGQALVCSTGGAKGGYWLAADWGELMDFLEAEINPRAMDLLETQKAMKEAAGRKFGLQERMF